MKYIRTKDGKIYKVEKEYKNEIVVASSKTGNSNLSFHKSFVSAQAETIEELCDALYFVEDEANCPHTVKRLDNIFDKDKKLIECCLGIGGWVTWLEKYSKKGCIKGAIFTSKGIIYVAKMNDKGELELL